MDPQNYSKPETQKKNEVLVLDNKRFNFQYFLKSEKAPYSTTSYLFLYIS